MVIEKPMFDIRNEEDFDDPAIAAREPCIPDFLLQTNPPPKGGAAMVVVETMGFASEAYRSRKAVTHQLMAATLKAPLVTHDFHFPSAQNQAERDRHFWSSARWAVSSAKDCHASTTTRQSWNENQHGTDLPAGSKVPRR